MYFFAVITCNKVSLEMHDEVHPMDILCHPWTTYKAWKYPVEAVTCLSGRKFCHK